METKWKQEYGVLENMIYVLKNAIRIQKELGILIPLYVLASLFLGYSIPVISSCIIHELENRASISWIVKFSIASFFICLMFYYIYIYTRGELEWQFYYIRTKFIERLMCKVMKMDYETLEAPYTQDLKRRAFNTTSGSNYGIQGMIETSISNVLNVVKLIVALILILVESRVVLVGVSVLTFIHFLIVDKTKRVEKLYTWDKMMPLQRKIEYLKNITSDFLYGKDIRLFQMNQWLTQKMQKENKKAHGLVVKAQNRWILSFGLNQIIDILQNSLLYGWIVYNVLAGKMGIAGVVLYLQVVQMFSTTLTDMLDNIADTRRKALEINDYRAFVEYPEKNQNISNDVKVNEKEYTFTFDNVSFRYSGQDAYTLKQINLTIKAGEKLAVVGVNGAGKTTLVKLLLRLYEPTEGRILLNGVDIRTINKDEYYEKFAPMFQECDIYAFTVEENIAMSQSEQIDKRKVKLVSKTSGMLEKINSLPQRFQSQLSKAIYDDGIDLSGGERQKLALARALYKDAKVLVLDEPTASLDALAESRLYSQFNYLIGNKTVIYISHRLASTKFCDRIIVMNQGIMEECGTHEELMNKDGLYKELFLAQAKYYKKSEVDFDE